MNISTTVRLWLVLWTIFSGIYVQVALSQTNYDLQLSFDWNNNCSSILNATSDLFEIMINVSDSSNIANVETVTILTAKTIRSNNSFPYSYSFTVHRRRYIVFTWKNLVKDDNCCFSINNAVLTTPNGDNNDIELCYYGTQTYYQQNKLTCWNSNQTESTFFSTLYRINRNVNVNNRRTISCQNGSVEPMPTSSAISSTPSTTSSTRMPSITSPTSTSSTPTAISSTPTAISNTLMPSITSPMATSSTLTTISSTPMAISNTLMPSNTSPTAISSTTAISNTLMPSITSPMATSSTLTTISSTPMAISNTLMPSNTSPTAISSTTAISNTLMPSITSPTATSSTLMPSITSPTATSSSLIPSINSPMATSNTPTDINNTLMHSITSPTATSSTPTAISNTLMPSITSPTSTTSTPMAIRNTLMHSNTSPTAISSTPPAISNTLMHSITSPTATSSTPTAISSTLMPSITSPTSTTSTPMAIRNTLMHSNTSPTAISSTPTAISNTIMHSITSQTATSSTPTAINSSPTAISNTLMTSITSPMATSSTLTTIRSTPTAISNTLLPSNTSPTATSSTPTAISNTLMPSITSPTSTSSIPKAIRNTLMHSNTSPTTTSSTPTATSSSLMPSITSPTATSSTPTAISSTTTGISNTLMPSITSPTATSSTPTAISSTPMDISNPLIPSITSPLATSNIPTAISSTRTAISNTLIPSITSPMATSNTPTAISNTSTAIINTLMPSITSPTATSSTPTATSNTSTATSSTLMATNSRPMSSSSSVTSSSISIDPTSLTNNDHMCPADPKGGWPLTKPGTNATRSGICYNGTVSANRYCRLDGEWDELKCQVSVQFSNTLNQIKESPEDGLNMLDTIISQSTREVSLSQVAFLLRTVLDTAVMTSTSSNATTSSFAKEFANVSNSVIISTMSEPDPDLRRSIGSQVLLSLDNLALNLIEPTGEVVSIGDDIAIRVSQFDQVPPSNTTITGIEIGNNSVTVPSLILGTTIIEPVRIGSFLYHNLSTLLPPRDNTTSIISPVISSTTNCQTCPVTDLQENVTIQLHIEMLPTTSDNVSCVFFQFERGDWNTSGCTTTINGSMVTCSCNHLTHFAILLSPGLEDVDPIHYEILSTIGLILIPISLLCMIIVILTFTLIRSLWSIRNYIHVMLCVSLSMAQLVFIIGVDKIKNEGACSAIAVLLQYLFLVSFMWMLMEGVILYVTLVRVFIDNHKYYIIAFTLTSYLIPAVYMMLIVPIGYLVKVGDISGHTHYLYYNDGHLTACWLSYESSFIWSFIVPVAIILLVNVGFFVMAIVIMRKHSKKIKNRGRSVVFKHWLKASISLTLVMGITWLAGLLAFRKELLFVAYIMTVFIAGQGLLLFIILVPLSKQVREGYFKCWITQKSHSTLLTRMSNTTNLFSSYSSNKNDTLKANLSKRKPNGQIGGIVIGTFGTDELTSFSSNGFSRTLSKVDETNESSCIKMNRTDDIDYKKPGSMIFSNPDTFLHSVENEYAECISITSVENQYETIPMNRNETIPMNGNETIPMNANETIDNVNQNPYQ